MVESGYLQRVFEEKTEGSRMGRLLSGGGLEVRSKTVNQLPLTLEGSRKAFVNIIVNGLAFLGHKCSICGALDSNPDTLSRHEERHRKISAQLRYGNTSYDRFGGERGKPQRKRPCTDGCG